MLHDFTKRRRLVVLLAVLSVVALVLVGRWLNATKVGGQQPADPFRIAGNFYYVGANDVAAFLITGPQGHVVLGRFGYFRVPQGGHGVLNDPALGLQGSSLQGALQEQDALRDLARQVVLPAPDINGRKAILEVHERREAIRGLEIVEEPAFLRHFSARFRQL